METPCFIWILLGPRQIRTTTLRSPWTVYNNNMQQQQHQIIADSGVRAVCGYVKIPSLLDKSIKIEQGILLHGPLSYATTILK